MIDREAEIEPPEPAAPRLALVADDRSFAAFYEAEADRLHRALAATFASPTVAREAVDEAMARAYASWATVGTYDAPAGWVYRTAVNWSIGWWRKHRREQALPEHDREVDRSADGDADPMGVVALDALRRLPLDQRSVVVCRILLELDTRETAVALDLAEGTVKSRLSRGLLALRTALDDPHPTHRKDAPEAQP